MMLARSAHAFHPPPTRPRTLAGAFRAARPLSSSSSSRSGLPGDRLPSLRRALRERPCAEGTCHPRPLRILETHNGLTGLIADRIACPTTGRSYDGMWSSSLTASAARAMPDIEAVDASDRLATVKETLAVTTKPLIYDADTGGEPEVFRFTVRALEQLGVSAAVVEDKEGLKRNSLFGTERTQTLASVEDFSARIRAGADAKRHPDFMVVARMESLIAGAGMDEALHRAVASVDAGANAVLVHSKGRCAGEVREFARRFRARMGETNGKAAAASRFPLVAVPSTYSSTTETELAEAGIDVCIYANQMLRAAYPAMVRAAGSILTHSRAHELEEDILPVKDIIRLIDDEGDEEGAGRAAMAALAFGPQARVEDEIQVWMGEGANTSRTGTARTPTPFPRLRQKLNGNGLSVMPLERKELLTASTTRSESTLAVAASDVLPMEDSDEDNEEESPQN